MAKRKKRLEKGIVFLEKQKNIHEEKKKLAEKLGQEELVRYYDKEIEKFVKEQDKKKNKIDKS